MARPKSLLVSMEITQAGHAHDCHFNKAHRILKGDKRLTVRENGNKQHYCLACARTFLVRDAERLGRSVAEVDGLLVSAVPPQP